MPTSMRTVPFFRRSAYLMAAIYIPYLALFAMAEPSVTLLFLWPIFPGITISAVLEAVSFLDWFRGSGSVVAIAVCYPALWLLVAWKIKTSRWLVIAVAVAALASLGLVQVMLLLLRA